MTLNLEKSLPRVLQAIVDCYTQNTFFMEFKMFFVIEVLEKLSYEQVDQILNSYDNNAEE